MQMTGQETLPVGLAEAWAGLNDVDLLKASITGCESLTPSGDNEFEAVMGLSIGPVKARFKGRLTLSDLQPPNSYRVKFEGSGGAAGHGKGEAQVKLAAQDAQSTLLSYELQASVGGKIAQLGSRLVDLAAQKLAGDFFKAFRQALVDKHGVADAEPAPEPEPGRHPNWLDLFWNWMSIWQRR